MATHCGNPQYSCLENPLDRGSWQATVHGVAKTIRQYLATKQQQQTKNKPLKTTPEDIVFEDKGVKVVVDGKSLQFLDGTQLDFVKEGLNEGFKFTNPNVKDECGCGESFHV